jgi:hypothetical protein
MRHFSQLAAHLVGEILSFPQSFADAPSPALTRFLQQKQHSNNNGKEATE